ncbi:hypothetical protein EDD37DRAFT_383330 [Exophiala viscosa]|uniref:uncharacterized protein n=1 Tax=Exophiala viscosa TaxID=2486360 RepID=UPI00219F1C7D|nr:hypothetical protein EDD37DRAFT_383330 [Exophiala viscosa]
MLPASAIFADIQHRWETYGFSIHGMPHVSQFPQGTLRRAPDPDSNEQPLRHKAHEMTPSRIDALRARQRALRERLEQLTPSVLASLSKGWPTGSSLSTRPSLGHGHKQTFPSLNTANMPSASQGKDQDERLSTASTLVHTTKPQEIRAKDQDDSLSTASTLARTTKPREIRAKDQDHSLSTASTLASTTKCWDIRGKEQDERLSTTSTLGPIIHYSGEYCKNAHELRDPYKKGLRWEFFEGTLGRAVGYKCASPKCHFKDQAIWKNKGWEIDDGIRVHPVSLRYRWLFLAKSHIHQQAMGLSSFRCLICTMFGDNSGPFRRAEPLLFHVAEHKGGFLGETKLEGRLIFSNEGAKPAAAADFDLDLSNDMNLLEENLIKPKDINFSRDVSEDIDPSQMEQQASTPQSPLPETTTHEEDWIDNQWAT